MAIIEPGIAPYELFLIRGHRFTGVRSQLRRRAISCAIREGQDTDSALWVLTPLVQLTPTLCSAANARFAAA